jgi:hypothetical protein
MQMLVSEDGKSFLALESLDGLGFGPGDLVDVTVQAGRNGVAGLHGEPGKGPFAGRIIDDPLTGLPVIDFGPDAPVLTNEQVLEMLADSRELESARA